MQPKQALSWYRRLSVIYGMGAWTLFGSAFYFFGKKKPSEGHEVEQKDLPRSEIVPEPLKGFYVETIVAYDEDYTSLSDRIRDFVKKWTGDSGSEP
ncbi:small integral membrane protein 26 [Fukomys damarensis]|uniref:small integral membrane protein 26 n=1 Tax=Fukomys damarensis TaxID=885580 RepID=UPI0014551775|nr:small integral membrane protein 26 [Fukomys damarensis]